mmetsp:Transcript_385/g.553  ORF Transcript_385/g.553 Transcript_385/m.553 type:complete len:89 (+) Transcript_385:205-471(+)
MNEPTFMALDATQWFFNICQRKLGFCWLHNVDYCFPLTLSPPLIHLLPRECCSSPFLSGFAADGDGNGCFDRACVAAGHFHKLFVVAS